MFVDEGDGCRSYIVECDNGCIEVSTENVCNDAAENEEIEEESDEVCGQIFTSVYQEELEKKKKLEAKKHKQLFLGSILGVILVTGISAASGYMFQTKRNVVFCISHFKINFVKYIIKCVK